MEFGIWGKKVRNKLLKMVYNYELMELRTKIIFNVLPLKF
jgi:hypothetical protein